MAKHTPEEIEAIKNAVKPLTPEERRRLRALREGEALPEEAEAKAEDKISPELEVALKAKAVQLGVAVAALTPDQVEEVKAAVVPVKSSKGKKKS